MKDALTESAARVGVEDDSDDKGISNGPRGSDRRCRVTEVVKRLRPSQENVHVQPPCSFFGEIPSPASKPSKVTLGGKDRDEPSVVRCACSGTASLPMEADPLCVGARSTVWA